MRVTKKPELSDFGIEPEDYALYDRRDSENCSCQNLLLVPSSAFMFGFVVMYLSRFEWATALVFGLVMVALSGFYVVGCIWNWLGSALVQSRRSRLLESPVFSQIKLYEEAQAAYNTMREQAKREQLEAERERRATQRAKQEAERVRHRKLVDHWMSLSGRELESEMEVLCRRLGYRVETTPVSGDRGVDLILRHESGKKVVVQCKSYASPVGPAAARELYGSMMDFGADKAVLVCPVGFTQGVRNFVKGKPIDLAAAEDLSSLAASAEATEKGEKSDTGQ